MNNFFVYDRSFIIQWNEVEIKKEKQSRYIESYKIDIFIEVSGKTVSVTCV